MYQYKHKKYKEHATSFYATIQIKNPTFEATLPTLFHIFRRVEFVSCCPSTEEIMNNAQGYFGTAGIRVDLCNLWS